jgi:hypothetical protein
MALSPKDDPRTWLLPGALAVPRPPLHARLLYYDLTTAERALLRAMFEYAPEGAVIKASPETLAGPSGVSVRNQWNLIHGRNRKDGSRVPGFLERRILDCKTRGRRAPHPKPAAYVFNEWACRLRPEVLACLEAGVQQTLPGIPEPGKRQSPHRHRQWLPMPIGNGCHRHRQWLPTIQKQLIQKQREIQQQQPHSLSLRKGELMSTCSSQVSPAVAELVQELTRRWPNHKKDASQLRLYVEDISELVQECGVNRVHSAVSKARIRCSFLPEPAELYELLPSPTIQDRSQLRDPHCPDCSGSGWKMIAVLDAGSNRANKIATRCNCRARPVAEKSSRVIELKRGRTEQQAKDLVIDVAKKRSMPQPPPRPRCHIVTPTKPLPVAPGMAMSADELRQRRDREREEIQEATKAS